VATGRRELAVAAALIIAACGGDDTQVIGPGTPALNAVNGAAFPILRVGEQITLAGLGFGDVQGAGGVVFRGTADVTAAPSDSTDWSNTHIMTVVPSGATSGQIEVLTDGGISLRLPTIIAARPTFDPATLTWTAATPLPIARPGIAAAVGQHVVGMSVETFVVALAGGDTAGDTTRVFLGRADASGSVPSWELVSSLPAPRTYAAIVLATPHTTRRSASPALYVAGGLSPSGQPMGTVIAASLSLPDGVVGEWVPVVALPEGLVAPRAILAGGMIYLTGGTDGSGTPREGRYVARVRADGALEGWFQGPPTQTTLVFHGSAELAHRLWVFGGAAGAVPPSSSDTLEPRRDDAASAGLSHRSGYFDSEPWRDGGPVFEGGRSRFATLRAGDYLLAVGGLYPGAALSLAETVGAALTDSTLGPFVGPVGTNTIAGLGGGIPVNAVGVSWHDLDGRARGLVLGGRDVVTGTLRTTAWRY